MGVRRLALFTLLALAGPFVVPAVLAQCPEQPRLDNFIGGGRVACPCFVTNEEAGAIFDLPAEEFPIEILRVGIGWGSQLGGQPNSLEDSIRIYPAGLPDPGEPVFILAGPELVDGAINEFNLEPFPDEIILESSPFTVTLRFLNSNSLNPYLPSMVHDGAGCQPGKNVVFAVPGGWTDGCSLLITGQWVVYVVYRRVNCGAGSVPDGKAVPGTPMECEKVAGGDLRLTWSPSCAASDDDYEVYEGLLGSLYSHDSKLCTTGGATSVTFTPDIGDRYYLVVPASASGEGSYGRDGNLDERPQGTSPCAAKQPLECP
jgi:hypothetical protein